MKAQGDNPAQPEALSRDRAIGEHQGVVRKGRVYTGLRPVSGNIYYLAEWKIIINMKSRSNPTSN